MIKNKIFYKCQNILITIKYKSSQEQTNHLIKLTNVLTTKIQ